MQDRRARDQCKACKHGRYTAYRPEIGYQLVKCGITNEIPIYYEKCDRYCESLPVLNDKSKAHKGVTQTGEILTIDSTGSVFLVKCRQGMLVGPPVETLSDCW